MKPVFTDKISIGNAQDFFDWATANNVTPLPEDYEVPYLPVLESSQLK